MLKGGGVIFKRFLRKKICYLRILYLVKLFFNRKDDKQFGIGKNLQNIDFMNFFWGNYWRMSVS